MSKDEEEKRELDFFEKMQEKYGASKISNLLRDLEERTDVSVEEAMKKEMEKYPLTQRTIDRINETNGQYLLDMMKKVEEARKRK